MTLETRAAKERPQRVRNFLCTKEQAELARKIMEEARELGGKVDNLGIQIVAHIPQRSSLLDPYTEGFTDLRQAAREQVLLANGADPEEVFIRSSIKKTKKEAFGERVDSFFFIVWKNLMGNVVASGEMNYMFNTPLVQKLVSLGLIHRDWQEIVCWDLGFPEHTLDETSLRFRRIQPETATFLFADEIEELRSGGQLLSYDWADLYEEAFEAYLIDKHPMYDWPTLFKIRGYLFD